MELAKGGELFDRLLEAGSLDEREAGRVMAQVGLNGITNVKFWTHWSERPFGLVDNDISWKTISSTRNTYELCHPYCFDTNLKLQLQDRKNLYLVSTGSFCCGWPPLPWNCASRPQAWKPSLLRQSRWIGKKHLPQKKRFLLMTPFAASASGWLWSLWVRGPALSNVSSLWDRHLSCPWGHLSDSLLKSSGSVELWCYCFHLALWLPSLLQGGFGVAEVE